MVWTHVWNFLETCLKHPLITLENSSKCPWNTLKPLNHRWNTHEISLKHPWNSLETPLKHSWITLETPSSFNNTLWTPLKHPWNKLETPLEQAWNTLRTTLKHPRNIWIKCFECSKLNKLTTDRHTNTFSDIVTSSKKLSGQELMRSKKGLSKNDHW